MKHKDVVIAVLATYLIVSFMPQLGLGSVLGKKPKG